MKTFEKAYDTFTEIYRSFSKYMKNSATVKELTVKTEETVTGLISVKWDYVTGNGVGFIICMLIFDEDLDEYFIDVDEFFLDEHMVESEYMETYSLDDDIDLSKVSMII